MENLAKMIINNAQTVYDGGILGDIFRNVKLFNNSNVKEEVMARFSSVRLSGGYGAALFFGCLWTIVLVAAMFLFCFGHFRRRSFTEGCSRVYVEPKSFKLKRSKKKGFTNRSMVRLFVLGSLVTCVLLLLSLSIVNLAALSRALTDPSGKDSNGSNESNAEKSMLPAMRTSLKKVRHFLSTFTDNARVDTVPMVEEMIEATKKIQKETMEKFNDALMTRLGVSQTFAISDEMTNIISQFFDISTSLLQSKKDYEQLFSELYPTIMDPSFGVFPFIKRLREAVSRIKECPEACQQAKMFFQKTFVSKQTFGNPEFASSFLFVMRQRNETKETVLRKSEHGRREMAKMMAKSERRLAEEIDIPEAIRNETEAGWVEMEEHLRGVIGRIDAVSMLMSNQSTVAAASKLALLAVSVLLAPLLLSVAAVVLALAVAVDGARSPSLRLAFYGGLFAVAVAVAAATAAFLAGGRMETELCRYLRTDQVPPEAVLDRDLNPVLAAAVRLAQGPPNVTLPVPRDVLAGLLHRCRQDEPILAVTNLLASIDPRLLARPGLSARIVKAGRAVLHEGLSQTDPRAMMPKDMDESLSLASQADMFVEGDVRGGAHKIPRSPLSEETQTGDGRKETRPVSVADFVGHADLLVTLLGDRPTSLRRDLQRLVALLERSSLATDAARARYRQLALLPAVAPVVIRLRASLADMLVTMGDRNRTSKTADALYDRLVAAVAPQQAAMVTASVAPRMLGALGRCRPLFEAYRATADTACDRLLPKVNAYWLLLGALVLAVTLLLAAVLLSVARLRPVPVQGDHHPPLLSLNP